MEGSDDETLRRIRPLVSIDFVRVKSVTFEIDDRDRNKIDDEDRNDTDEIDGNDMDGNDMDEIDGAEYKEKRYILDGIFRNPSLGGSVIVTDCLGNAMVFNQYTGMSSCHLPLPLPEQLLLKGPRRAISGKDRFCIRVGFWLSWPKEITKEICNGEITWDPDNRDQSSYDKPLEEDVCGEYGSVTVGYSVIREALSATIDVVWMNESRARIFGTVKAVRTLGGSSTTRILFDRSVNRWDAREVFPNYTIFCNPFSGKETLPFPVQMHSNLTIMVDLMDRLSRDRRVLGSVEFTPKFVRQEMNITGKHGEVQVSITCECE